MEVEAAATEAVGPAEGVLEGRGMPTWPVVGFRPGASVEVVEADPVAGAVGREVDLAAVAASGAFAARSAWTVGLLLVVDGTSSAVLLLDPTPRLDLTLSTSPSIVPSCFVTQYWR